MLVFGVDPSAKSIALVGYEDFTNSVVVRKLSLYGKGATRQTPESLASGLTQLESFILSVEHMVGKHDQRFAFVEKPLVGRGGVDATLKQAYVGGIIRACFARAGYTVMDANPSTWRGKLGIKAKGTVALKKAAHGVVASRAPKVIAQIGQDYDLADAAAIALYGQGVARLAQRIAESAQSPVP